MMDPSTNREQIEYWNVTSGARWVALQEATDAQLGPFGAAAIEALVPSRGARILDVGCGCGDTSLALARIVGPEGEVLGLDVSAPMLERARARAAEAMLRQLRFERADAQVAALPRAHYDALFSRFGVMFFSDPVAAFANLGVALVPRAALAFVCWRPIAENPFMMEPLLAAGDIVPLPEPTPPRAPGPFAFADAEYVRAILVDAGFVDVRLEPVERTIAIGGERDLDEAARFLLGVGPAAAAVRLANADADTVERVRVAIRERLRPFHTARGVELPGRVWIVTARRP